jgi:hypothetical protein
LFFLRAEQREVRAPGPFRTDQFRTGQFRTGQFRTGQIRTGEIVNIILDSNPAGLKDRGQSQNTERKERILGAFLDWTAG